MTQLLKTVVKALDDARLNDIVIYDFSDASPFYDYQIVASAKNERQVHSSIHHIKDALPAGVPCVVEGKQEDRWLLFDLGDIIVHVMHQETRNYYQIEKLFIERDKISFEGDL